MDLVPSICAWKVFSTRQAIKLQSYTLEGYFKLFAFSYDLRNHIMKQMILIMHNDIIITGDWNSDQTLRIK